MANSTAAQAYTAVTAIEATDVAADGSSMTVTKQSAIDKIIADNSAVTTKAEALVGIRLAQGAPDAATSLTGEYHQNKIIMVEPKTKPADNVLFASDGDIYVTSMS